MRLNELRDNPGARKSKLRVGRGIGSGMGKTSRRGVKGYKARSGSTVKGFEGGQMPLHMRLPKRGFTSPNKKVFELVNFSLLQKAIDAGKLDAKNEITREALLQAGLLHDMASKIKLLAKGELKTAVTMVVDAASDAAKAHVEKLGGQLKTSN